MRQIVLDTETTGLSTESGHRIIEIGCLELVNRKLTGRRFHEYINPGRAIDAGALAVHGISNEFLQDKPVFSALTEKFIEFIDSAELIIHNAPFDIGFLNYELKLLNAGWKPITDYCEVIDTLVLARQLHVGQRNSLDALCKRYNVDNSDRDLHGALVDANLLAQVYLLMTGGQGSLFGEMAPTSENTAETHKRVELALNQVERKKLRVIKADADELSENDKRLQEMVKKGKCLWVEGN